MMKKFVMLFFDFILLVLTLFGFVKYSGLLNREEFSLICLVFVPAILYFVRNIIIVFKYPTVNMPGWVEIIFALFGFGVFFGPSEILKQKK